VSRYLRSIGVDATAHTLRHYAGTTWYRASGHDLLTTAALLRHKDVSTTQVYARVDDERPTEVVHAVGLGNLSFGPDQPDGDGAERLAAVLQLVPRGAA